MPTPTKGPRLGGGPAHERLILANLATALFEHDRITTTEAKAKRLRPLAERLITFSKRGDLHARRRVLTVIRDKGVVHRLFEEIAPDMAERPGGYTRITKIPARKGDNAPMAVIELVREPVNAKPKRAVVAEAEGAAKKSAKDAAAAEVPAEAPADEVVETEAVETEAAAPATLVDTDADAAAEAPADAAEATDGGFGADSAAPTADGSAPAGFDVKGNKDSMKYHVPGSRWYDATEAEVWFTTGEAAAAAGFEPAGGDAAQTVEA